nr:cell wall protein DAN4-like [Penaeus vannamei]
MPITMKREIKLNNYTTCEIYNLLLDHNLGAVLRSPIRAGRQLHGPLFWPSLGLLRIRNFSVYCHESGLTLARPPGESASQEGFRVHLEVLPSIDCPQLAPDVLPTKIVQSIQQELQHIGESLDELVLLVNPETTTTDLPSSTVSSDEPASPGSSSTTSASSGASVQSSTTDAPVETTKTQAPVETTETQAPVETTETQAPVETTKTQAPVETTETQAPVETTKTQAPVETTKTQAPRQPKTQAPVETTKTQAPVETTKTQAPVETTKTPAPVETTEVPPGPKSFDETKASSSEPSQPSSSEEPQTSTSEPSQSSSSEQPQTSSSAPTTTIPPTPVCITNETSSGNDADLCERLTSVLEDIEAVTSTVAKGTMGQAELDDLRNCSTRLDDVIEDMRNNTDFLASSVDVEELIARKDALDEVLTEAEKAVEDALSTDDYDPTLAIVLGVLGGLLGVGIIGYVGFTFYKKNKAKKARKNDNPMTSMERGSGQDNSAYAGSSNRII